MRLGLINATTDNHRAVVITHDCDLAHPGEPIVEVIVATQLGSGSERDSQLSYGKNPRRLQLTYTGTDAAPLTVELKAFDRRDVPKHHFIEHAQQDKQLSLTKEEKRSLKLWLAARYGRPAFPNAFEERLRKHSGKRTVEQLIARILEPEAKYLVGLFFDLGEQRGTEAGNGELYALSISVVYDSTEGGSDARLSAERVATNLRALFENTYGGPNVATEIALDVCEAIADTHLTLADLRRVDQWRLEYISLRGDDQGALLPAGEIPA